jgi:hypothetical protein
VNLVYLDRPVSRGANQVSLCKKIFHRVDDFFKTKESLMKKMILALCSAIVPFFNAYGSTSDKVSSSLGAAGPELQNSDEYLLDQAKGSMTLLDEDFSLDNKTWT